MIGQIETIFWFPFLKLRLDIIFLNLKLFDIVCRKMEKKKEYWQKIKRYTELLERKRKGEREREREGGVREREKDKESMRIGKERKSPWKTDVPKLYAYNECEHSVAERFKTIASKQRKIN